MIRLALIPGDGIGVEVMESAKEILRAVEKAYGAEFATPSWTGRASATTARAT